jgi:hypothetical protein
MEHFLVRIDTNGSRRIVDQYYNARSLRYDAKKANQANKANGSKVRYVVMSENKIAGEGLI